MTDIKVFRTLRPIPLCPVCSNMMTAVSPAPPPKEDIYHLKCPLKTCPQFPLTYAFRAALEGTLVE